MEHASENNVTNDAEIASPPLQKRTDNQKSAPNETEYDDLIAGLGNDIVLGQVVTKLLWHERPVLRTLSRSWAHALIHSFSSYASLHHPHILSNSIVLSRRLRRKPPSNNSNEGIALWIYSCNHDKMKSLPVPPIPPHLQQYVKFVCDDNEECIYSFTRVLEKGVYDVNVLDLRNCSRWKRLPSLPLYNDNCEYQEPYSCSSSSASASNGDCSITYTIYIRKIYTFSQWTFALKENDNDSEGKWKWECFSSFSAEEKKPPIYLEIERYPGQKAVYQRCLHFNDNDAAYEGWGTDYLLMFQEDGVDQPAVYSFYYEISISLYNVHLHKMMCSTRIVGAGERVPSWMLILQPGIDSSNLLDDGEERSAIEVQVAQRRHLYLYRRISFWT